MNTIYIKMKGFEYVLNFLPMIIIYLVATYSSLFAKWSHTRLGKAIAIAILLIYVFTDITSGLLACALIILYYQTDYVESFYPLLKEIRKTNITIIEIPKQDEIIKTSSNKIYDELLDIEDAYPLEPTIPIVDTKQKERFIKTHCSKGHLVHKGLIVKPEMSQHIFPEIKQDSFHKCNICDHSCRATVA
jgi:hypothetical protein